VFLLVPAYPGSPGQRAIKRFLLFVVVFLRRRTRLTGPWLGLNSRPAAHCARHALLHMAPKWSSHWTTREGSIIHIVLIVNLNTLVGV